MQRGVIILRFTCPLIAVSDLEASKKFYQEVLGQNRRICKVLPVACYTLN